MPYFTAQNLNIVVIQPEKQILYINTYYQKILINTVGLGQYNLEGFGKEREEICFLKKETTSMKTLGSFSSGYLTYYSNE